MTKQWNSLPGEAVPARLDMTLSNLTYWLATLPMAGGVEVRWSLRSLPTQSILWFLSRCHWWSWCIMQLRYNNIFLSVCLFTWSWWLQNIIFINALMSSLWFLFFLMIFFFHILEWQEKNFLRIKGRVLCFSIMSQTQTHIMSSSVLQYLTLTSKITILLLPSVFCKPHKALFFSDMGSMII